MIFIRKFYTLLFVICCFCNIHAQSFKLQKNTIVEDPSIIRITWNAPISFMQKGKLIKTLSFIGVDYIKEKSFLPYLYLKDACKQNVQLKPVIQVVSTESLTAQEEASVNTKYLSENFDILDSKVNTYRKVPYMYCKLVPIRINKTSGKPEKLTAYRLQWQQTAEPVQSNQRNGNQHNTVKSYASSSVLASGTWYKIGTAQNAVYKIDRPSLQNMLGKTTDLSTIDPRHIKLYGNGGELLSEANSDFHYDDLLENAIFFNDNNANNVFDADDYILFYGQSPHKWKYQEGSAASTRYSRLKHYYSDSVFYFLTIDNSSFGKRITTEANATAAVNYMVTSFDDYAAHENDLVSLVNSGRELYGEDFENTASYSFNFSFPYLQSDTIWLTTTLLGRITDNSSGQFNVSYPGGSYPLTFSGTGTVFDDDIGYPQNGTGSTYFIYTNQGSPNVNNSINITVNRSSTDETGWLNYIWTNVRRELIMQGGQMGFRDYRSVGANRISQFNLQSNAQNMGIWDVSDQFNIAQLQPSFSSGNFSFTLSTDSLKQFIAFDGTSFETPAFLGQVPNQNLHATVPVDYIIVSYPGFLKQAQELANLHAQQEHYTSVIVTPDEIYNEFSSGAQDITAIRQFVRMLYKNAGPGTATPQYLLLYGTGSYKQKNRYDPSNTVFVPAFETYNSWSYLNSLTSDDFYAYLDDNEGVIGQDGTSGGLIDIGVGRIPAKNAAEAEGVAQKTIQYYNRSEPTANCCDQATQNTPDWRNWVCLIADDANPDPGGNTLWETGFLTQQEINDSVIHNPRYNIDKIYEDAYVVEAVPGGRRYPGVNAAINDRIAKGALIMGYSGHGGTLNLSHEDIIDIPQIDQWTNIDNMPLFYTATCQFSTYDDPSYESAGEDIVLNSKGGGIGSFTTCRAATIQDGANLGPHFYPAALDSFVNGRRPGLGDIIRITKYSAPNELNFTLLGDPAVTLSYPKQYTGPAITVNTHTYVQGSGINDTLSALGKYTITGNVCDVTGNKLTSFNGNMYITVFDKPISITTLDNSQNQPASSYMLTFKQQESVLFKGKATVSKGDFSYTFIVPKDIMYNFGFGKISYYAQADTTDAAGYFVQVIVGGASNTPIVDHQGPGINLYLNDSKFVPGGITNQNPFIYAVLSDSSGINTSGNGLGHNIVAVVDANTAQEVILNDYYQADLNKYQSGKILYQLSNLSNGNHTLNMRVWDVLDNSSNASTDFVVAQNAQIALAHVLNYPNPFTTSTKFFIEHNQACDYLNVEVQIFTISGKIVKTILQTVENQGFRTDGINWDGRDDYGDKLARGVYIYKVVVKNSEGNTAEKMEKLVILN
jgi:hypothetical protein